MSLLQVVCFLMLRRHTRCTRTVTRFPCTSLFRSRHEAAAFVTLRHCHLAHRNRPDPLQLLAHRRQVVGFGQQAAEPQQAKRSEKHTSELQSLMRISYADFCLKKKQKTSHTRTEHHPSESHKINHHTHTD